MSRSVRDLREFICLSRFGFRSDEDDSGIDCLPPLPSLDEKNSLLFYFDPSNLNNWLEITSSRLDKLRSLSNNDFISFAHFWLEQLDYTHKHSLILMEFELVLEHLLLAFTPGDLDSSTIDHFARKILVDIDRQLGQESIVNDHEMLYRIDVFSRRERDNEYRSLLADLPADLISQTTNRLHLQWMLAIRAFGLVAVCAAAVDFYENIQQKLEQARAATDGLPSSRIDDQSLSITQSDRLKDRILLALRKGYIDVMDYFIKTNQLTGCSLDKQNRNILFHALPIGTISMIDYLLKANLPDLDINAIAESGNSLLHMCVNLQRIDIAEQLIKSYPQIHINQRNRQDATPLHLAIIFGQTEMVKLLIDSGGDISLSMKTKTCSQLANEFDQQHLFDLLSS